MWIQAASKQERHRWRQQSDHRWWWHWKTMPVCPGYCRCTPSSVPSSCSLDTTPCWFPSRRLAARRQHLLHWWWAPAWSRDSRWCWSECPQFSRKVLCSSSRIKRKIKIQKNKQSDLIRIRSWETICWLFMNNIYPSASISTATSGTKARLVIPTTTSVTNWETRTFCSSLARLLQAVVQIVRTWAPQGRSAEGEDCTSLH